MIEIHNVSYRIKDKHILKNNSCKIDNGKLTAIIGPNGSGKSTLLKCIIRLIKYSGNIIIDGQSVLQRFDLAKKVTYFAQSSTVAFPQTVFNTVLMGRRPHTPYRYIKKDQELTKDAINEMGLTHLTENSIVHLSGGELQKVFFARALVQDTPYLLLDEPFNNLDPYYRSSIIKKLLELKNEKSIIVVLHDIELLRFFDFVIMIKEGEIINNIVNCETLKKLYDVPFKEYGDLQNRIYVPIM
jgi:iron complex transport system ATP-binding protein